MTDFATSADVAALRPLTDVETVRVTLLLGYASVLIRQQVPDVDIRVTSGVLSDSVPRLAAVSMVLRALQQLAATAGAKSESTTTGPYTHSVTYAEAVGTGLIRLSADDLAMLLPTTPGPVSSGVGTIRLSPGFTSGWSGIW